jgi:predicted secreted protein
MFALRGIRQLVFIAGFAAGAGLSPFAQAGDIANVEVIGFSPNGDYFAFEQYGRQDGSGFPYSEIFIIDTKANRWIGESPFDAVAKDEKASPTDVRVQSRAKATSMLLEYKIKLRGLAIASNPVTELDANANRVRVNPNHTVSQIERPVEFRMNSYRVDTPRCRKFTRQAIRGFRLTADRPGERQQTIHKDTRIPRSRGCPVRYAIRMVHVYRPEASEPVMIIIVGVFRVGFEGPDVRYIAIPYRDYRGF